MNGPDVRRRPADPATIPSGTVPAAPERPEPRSVVFVSHGAFDSNSGGHVCHFANALGAAGLDVTVVAPGDKAGAGSFGPVRFAPMSYEEAKRESWSRLLAGRSLLHAWTPREKVAEVADAILAKVGCPYLVHLEDHEIHVTEAFSATPWAELERMSDREVAARVSPAFSRPATMRRFLAGAAGMTVIVETLRDLVPAGTPVHLLEPGIEGDRFAPDLGAARAAELRAELGIAPATRLVAYHGNGHVTNRRELFSLYTAILILRRRGHDIRLLRFGTDDGEPLDVSYPALAGEVSLAMGYVPRDRLVECLKLADLFVQPGAPSRFNDFRFPSKLPEFLALGRPVILPRTNLGLRLTHGREAWVLDRCDGESIAAAAEVILGDPDLAARLGRNGRRFALATLDWQRNGEALLPFYAEALARAPRGGA